jgi:aminomethyltransferase
VTEAGINRLALHAVHEAYGATFALHGGWRLPETYGDSEDEYARLRSSAVAFDRSDRTRLLVSGTDAATVLAAVFGEAAGELEEGRAVRAAALDAGGRIADLALVARTGGIAYMVMGEPGRAATTLSMLEEAVGEGYDVVIQDRTSTTCLVGIAGPGAAEAAARHVNEALPPRLPPMHAAPFEFHGYRALAVRTSSLGEDGFEFMVAPPVAEHLLGLLQASGVGPAGMGALDLARIEAGVPAFTPDLETGLTPAEAGLSEALGLPADEPERVLSAVLFEGSATPPLGAPALADEQVVGELRSCARSFALDAAAGLAILTRNRSHPGTAILVGGERALVAQKPLYRRRKR